MKTRILVGLISMLMVLLPDSAFARQYKNVIVMIPDGMSVTSVTLTRWYRGGAPLNMDGLLCGQVRTHNADSLIGDSAPAATAMATGFKSHTGYISMLPEENTMPGLKPLRPQDRQTPVATVLEAARLKGMSTGLVVTCEVMHATPAAFASHDISRKNYDSLSEQEVFAGMDVVFGGGYKYFTPEGRKDGQDMISEMKSLGYQVITGPSEMDSLKKSKVFGLFAPVAMAYDMDRDPQKEPSLAQMTKKAIDILSGNPKGFFLMVEGSKIDWAAHANDPVGIISDMQAFDKAVEAALHFARKDGNTAILIMSDHGNSGISIGDETTSKDYDKRQLGDLLDVIKKAENTGEGVEAKLQGASDDATVTGTVCSSYGICDLSGEEISKIKDCLKNKGELNTVLGPMMGARSIIGFTTFGHTGEDVNLYAYAPGGVKPSGVIDNTDIAKITAGYLGVDLAKTTKRLFTDADTLFSGKGVETGTDATDPLNPVFVASKGGREIRIEANRSYATVKGKRISLEGPAIYNQGRWFVPEKAAGLLVGK
ncbi:MAG TPA: alkaline phosphatase [Desulfomonilia bacterium]